MSGFEDRAVDRLVRLDELLALASELGRFHDR